MQSKNVDRSESCRPGPEIRPSSIGRITARPSSWRNNLAKRRCLPECANAMRRRHVSEHVTGGDTVVEVRNGERHEQGVSAAHATRQQQVCERRKTQDGSGRAQELKRVGGEVVGRWHRVGARRG